MEKKKRKKTKQDPNEKHIKRKFSVGFIVSSSAETKGSACAGHTLPSRDLTQWQSGAKGPQNLLFSPFMPFTNFFSFKLK